jgi:hypothetical protein
VGPAGSGGLSQLSAAAGWPPQQEVSIRRNVVKGSGGDAFQVAKKDDHSVLKHNIARRAGADGFSVQSPSARLAGNRAFQNADLGIRGRARGDRRRRKHRAVQRRSAPMRQRRVQLSATSSRQ